METTSKMRVQSHPFDSGGLHSTRGRPGALMWPALFLVGALVACGGPSTNDAGVPLDLAGIYSGTLEAEGVDYCNFEGGSLQSTVAWTISLTGYADPAFVLSTGDGGALGFGVFLGQENGAFTYAGLPYGPATETAQACAVSSADGGQYIITQLNLSFDGGTAKVSIVGGIGCQGAFGTQYVTQSDTLQGGGALTKQE